ncbi:MAG: hypothetical protein JRH11_28245 [Deltaproteobacteria bacterium]|nr:hypothetical protein [Deltaproteobacteria bacterium]
MTDLDVAPLALRALSAAVFLAISVLAVRRAVEVPLARPLGVFTLGLFTYSLLEILSPGDAHPWLNAGENIVASLIFIPAIELLLGFAGRRTEFRRVRIASYLVFVPLALSCCLPALDPDQDVWTPRHWEIAMTAGIVLFFGLCAVVLVTHFRRSKPVERTRTMLLLGALLLGGVGATSTLLRASLGTPDLIAVGMMSTGVLLALLFFRTKLLEGTTNLAFVTAGVFAALVVLGELLLLPMAGQATAVFVGGTIVLVVFAFAALRPVFQMAAQDRVRTEHLANLGRLSKQMAHDLKNPLQAMLLEAQYLQEELRLGHAFEDQGPVLDAIVEQIGRLRVLIDDYPRLARVEPVRKSIDADEFVVRVVAGQRRATPTGVVLEAAATELGFIQVDPDLVATVLENLICNAFEAMTDEGTVPGAGTVRVSAVRHGGAVHITVADQGPGMNARVLEEAHLLYFSTKASGSGLGLAQAGGLRRAS